MLAPIPAAPCARLARWVVASGPAGIACVTASAHGVALIEARDEAKAFLETMMRAAVKP
jgi:acyl-homoserine lactone acylase PvdQ